MAEQKTGFQPPTNNTTPLEMEQVSIVTRSTSSEAALMEASVKLARQFPRNESKIVAHLRDTLNTYPQFAEKLLYSIPYRDNRSGRQVKVEGLSIRAAETLASAWGNLRIGVRFLDEDEGGINLEAVVFDMETNLTELAPGRALKMMKTREGRLVLLDERAFLQARGAAVSKVKRNAVLSVLPLHIKAFLEAEVRRHMAGGELTMPASKDRIERATTWYKTNYQITVEQLETYVGKPTTLWIGEDIADLQGLKNALEQGETTVAEAFAVETPDAPSPNVPVVVDVKNGQLQASPRPEEPSPAVAVPMPPPNPVAPPPPKPKRARGGIINPTPVAMPEATPILTITGVTLPDPTPVPGGVDEPALRLRLSAEIAGASTPEALDAILGRIYLDPTVPRGVKRDALDLVTTRRDALQAQP